VARSVVLAMPGAETAARVVSGDLGVTEVRTVAPDDPLAAGAPRGAQVVLVVGPDAPGGDAPG
jgi:hypothetical protein